MCSIPPGDQLRVGVTQADIARLLEAGSHTVSDAVKLAVVPQDPRLPMDKGNAVLVTRQQRRTLLNMLAAGGMQASVNEMICGSYTDAMPESVMSGTQRTAFI